MTSNALYYPYIRVPEGPWFTRVLLYWDRVGAIVPHEFIEDPDRLGPYMVSLVRENLVEQVIPGAHLWRVNNFANSFLEYVDAKYGYENEPYQSQWARVHAEKLGGASIHMEKLHDLADRLCDRGMARRDMSDPYSQWLKVEPRIADDFMAYVAGVLGQMSDEVQFSPITNHQRTLNSFTPSSSPEDTKFKLRKLLLEAVLPAPMKALEASRLLEFKQKYQEPLHRFRNQLEDRVSELAVIADEELQQMRKDDITASLRETIDEITARMSEQPQWPHLDFGSLCAITGSILGGWKSVMDQDWKFGVTSAAVGLAPAVYRAFKGTTITLHDKPLAYAALAEKHLLRT